MHISIIAIIMIIAEQFLTAGKRPVQWELRVNLSYLFYDMSSRNAVVLSNFFIL